jgi:hypothetical protein
VAWNLFGAADLVSAIAFGITLGGGLAPAAVPPVRARKRCSTPWSFIPTVLVDVRSCLIDGEVVVCDEQGLAVFDLLRRGSRVRHEAHLYAFDLLELDGRDRDT